jgi:two-component system, sensor histidine kinase YesM
MFISLRNRLLLIFTCLLTIPFVILSLLIPNLFTSVIREQTQELTTEMMDQYLLYVDSITTQAQDLGKQVLVNQTTQEWLRAENQGVPNETGALMSELRMLLSSIMINNSNAISLSVQHTNGTGTWGNNPSLFELDWYKDFTHNNQNFVHSHLDPHQQSQEMRDREVNSYMLPLIDTNTLVSSGFIKVNFPTSLLETALNKMTIGQSGRTYLLDEYGANVLSDEIETPNEVLQQSLAQITNNEEQKGLIETAYEKENYLVFYQKLPIGNWVLISEVTESDLFSRVNHLQRILLITSFLVFFLTIIASFMFSSTITSPLEKLARAMGFIEQGDFTSAKKFMPTIKSNNDEVGYLVKVTEHTIDQLKNLIETEYETNLRRKDAEYKALLLQINPHFLNNTLEIIGSLALQGKNKEVMNVSIYLGKMLRYSLNTNSNVVLLGEEINYISSYTDILKLRYEDMISVKINEDPDTKKLPIIKFILQPLVENAVKYSFSEKAKADIFIKTEKTQDGFVIVVEDKGTGMPEEVMLDLLKEDKNEKTISVLESKGNSIGLRNVLGRLKLYYGQDFSYKIESERNIGTRITLQINGMGGDIHAKGDHRG